MRESIIQHGFLRQEFFDRLDESWPEPPKSRKFRSDHDINHADPEFDALPEPWQELREWVCSKGFWLPMMMMFPSLRGVMLDKFDPKATEIKGQPEGSGVRQYPRLDIGWGGMGYGRDNGGRGVHIDSPERLISGLLYFSDQSEMDGGEFEIVTSSGELVHRVPLRKNTCIMTVQNADGWHRVNPVTRIDGWRRAVYIALSDTRRILER